MDLFEMIERIKEMGYDAAHAEARLCQDIVMRALAKSSLNRNVTIKGGVVMRSISHDARRATQDLDLDFIRYSLADESIERFIDKLNCLDGINIIKIGNMEELKQQDYHGKRVHIQISDEYGYRMKTKIDLGVHKNLSIEQEEYCFDICFTEEGASLLINSKEQMFTEKLRSLLKFGQFSTRHKDIFDMYYLCSLLNKERLLHCIRQYIFQDNGMKENNLHDVINRVSKTFHNKNYRKQLSSTKANWLEIDVVSTLQYIENFLNDLIEGAA